MRFSIKGIFSVLVILSIMLAFTGCADKLADSKLDGGDNKVIATVGEVSVVNGDIQKRFSDAWTSQYAQMTEGDREVSEEDVDSRKAQLFDQILKDYIFWVKVNTFLDTKGFSVSQEAIDAELSRIAFFNDFDSTEDFFAEQLKENNTTKEEITKQIRDGLNINNYILSTLKSLDDATLLTEDDIKAYYDENKERFFVKAKSLDLSVITLDYQDDEASEDGEKKVSRNIDEAFNLADEILVDLENGESFDKLAKKYSDSYSKEDGAIFREGFTEKGAYPIAGENLDAVLALGVGEWTEAFDFPMNGYVAIYYADALNESKEISFEDMKKSIEERLVIQQNREIVSGLVEEIESSAEVTIMGEEKEKLPDSIFDGSEESATEEVVE